MAQAQRVHSLGRFYQKHIVVAFDPKPHITNLLIKHLADSIHSENPHSIYVPLAQLAVDVQEDAVWRIRDAVRDVEKSRTAKSNSAELRLSHVHDLARHTIQVNETLDLTAQTLHSMIEYHNRFADRPATPPAAEDADDDATGSRGIRTTHQQQQARHDRLRCFQGAIQALRPRSVANKDRLHNEIQYSFDLVTQNISNKSNDIHQAIQSDSSVMKTVALATAAFIPMTFVATLFGTQFFLYRAYGSWNMSDKFWIFWATGIPFTLLVAFLSYSYHRRGVFWRSLLCLRQNRDSDCGFSLKTIEP